MSKDRWPSSSVMSICSAPTVSPVRVEDHEIGAFAANFHPRDACRYLVNLANLRGGLDNITVVIVRIGAWIDPDSTEVLKQSGEFQQPTSPS